MFIFLFGGSSDVGWVLKAQQFWIPDKAASSPKVFFYGVFVSTVQQRNIELLSKDHAPSYLLMYCTWFPKPTHRAVSGKNGKYLKFWCSKNEAEKKLHVWISCGKKKCLNFNLSFYFYIERGKDSTPPPFSKNGLLSAKSGLGPQLSTSLEAHEVWKSESLPVLGHPSV